MFLFFFLFSYQSRVYIFYLLFIYFCLFFYLPLLSSSFIFPFILFYFSLFFYIKSCIDRSKELFLAFLSLLASGFWFFYSFLVVRAWYVPKNQSAFHQPSTSYRKIQYQVPDAELPKYLPTYLPSLDLTPLISQMFNNGSFLSSPPSAPPSPLPSPPSPPPFLRLFSPSPSLPL